MCARLCDKESLKGKCLLTLAMGLLSLIGIFRLMSGLR